MSPSTRAAALAVILQLLVAVSGLVSFGRVGGPEGTAFTDYVVGTQNTLTSVTVVVCQSTSLVGQLQVVYGATTVTHGGYCVGTTNTVTLGANDYVLSVTGWQTNAEPQYMAVVSALSFVTNNTATGIVTKYGPWGTTQQNKNLTALAPDGYALAFFSGHATTTGVNELVFNFAPMALETGAWGGNGGSAFSDAGFAKEELASVSTYTSAYDGRLTMLKLTYRNGSVVSHGQLSENVHTLVLAPGEHINEAWACAGSSISDLFFSTSLDQMLDSGIQTGDPWHYYNAPFGCGLVYVTGKSSTVLDQLNFHFGPVV